MTDTSTEKPRPPREHPVIAGADLHFNRRTELHADFPFSSNVTRAPRSAQTAAISLPTAVNPVNATLSTPACVTSTSDASRRELYGLRMGHIRHFYGRHFSPSRIILW